MNLKQLEAFVCIAELKSFSKAAKKLYLAQPTVSAQVNLLEKELESKLFLRTTREVQLSEDGKRLYHNAKLMVRLEEEIIKEFREKKNPQKKKIKVGASTIPGQYILPHILPLFFSTYPKNQLEMIEEDSIGVIKKVLNHEIEVGFTGTKTEDENCMFEPFYYDRLIIITPRTEKYSQYNETGFPLEQLYEERLIVREEGSGTRKESESYLKGCGIDWDKLEIVATISNQESIKKSVSNGMGISIISSVAVEDYVQQKRLWQFPLAGEDLYRKLYMVWNKNNEPSIEVKLFIQFVREFYEYL